MIPKIIHYCWFGKKPLPELAIKCLDSWKKFFPDYEIKKWNEENFDCNCCEYVKEAYAQQKWAFVSDYARFWILYNYGGLYFDTDVEVIKDMHVLVDKGSFMGCESLWNCAPGLGLSANPGLGLYRDILDYYHALHFVKEKKQKTVVEITSELLANRGWSGKNQIENVDGITIYPSEYFCPKNYYTGVISITDNTYTVHHYDASWLSANEKKMVQLRQFCLSHFGQSFGKTLYSVLRMPLRVTNRVEYLISDRQKRNS